MATEASVNDTHNTNLYYEGHITLEPFEVGNYGYLEASMEAACAMFDMRLSTFAMFKDDQAQPDAFVSLRSDTYVDMCDRIGAAVTYLKDKGHTIKRYKIEDILMDSRRQDDPLKLGVPCFVNKE